MKKLFLITIVIVVVLVGCNSNSTSATKGIEVGESEFLITPQGFIDQWNSSIDLLRENNKGNKDYTHILPLPDFVDSDKKAFFLNDNNDMWVKYLTNNETGNLTQFEIEIFELSATNEQQFTFGYMCGAIPQFFKPSTEFRMQNEFSFNSGLGITDFATAFDDDIKYDYFTYDTLTSIKICPKW